MERSQDDIQELNKLLNDAEDKIIVTEDQTINLLGKTGAGKSTLLCLLSRFEPKVEFQPDGGVYVDFNQNQGSNIVIGHSSTSCTTLPNFKKIHQQIYWDCPGFCDNKSVSQEIVNLYCTKRIFESAHSYKIVLVIEFSSISAARGKDISETFKQLVEMFPNQDSLFDSLSIVITKCINKRYNNIMFVNGLKKMAEENNEFESSRYLIRMLSGAHNKISIFKSPEDENDINDDVRIAVQQSISNSNFTRMQVKNSLSDKAKLVIDNLIKFYESDIENKMEEFAKDVIIKFRSEVDMEKLDKGKSALDEFALLSDGRNLNIENFKTKLKDLSQYFTDSKALIEKVENLAYRIHFYNSYRSAGSPAINLNSWIMPLRAAKAELESIINFRDKEMALKQAEAFKKENQEKVLELENKIKAINNNENQMKLYHEMLQKSIEASDKANKSLKDQMDKNEEMENKYRSEQQEMNRRIIELSNRPQKSSCLVF
ncbi:hypothetical protein SteCoe_8051 [Stentor coeruleus]|uniref:G domain-containing protein n=1 Tax=Stentor coeruleus TaxID=5963 RepID=A0A1R2CL00_9CILI|nr:hypothetical protein SteCoe_8051 [Stentor coeruleus]